MTLEEKIDAFVLAQGNQVGAGAELAGILKEIAGGMINVPVITDEEYGEISLDRYSQLRNSALIKHNGSFYCLCSATDVVDGALRANNASSGELFMRNFVVDGGAVDYLEGIIIYEKDGDFYAHNYDI